MFGLGYSSYIIDVSLEFICTILGLLHFFDVGKYFQKYSGIIGLVTGMVGFILTLVYIIYSEYIFTKDLTLNYDNDTYSGNHSLNLKWNGAFAELDGDKFKCIFYKKDEQNSIYDKYNDLGKKSFNYEKKKEFMVILMNIQTVKEVMLLLNVLMINIIWSLLI